MTFADMTRRLSKFAVDNSPTILTSIGVMGTATTAYLAAQAAFRTARVVDLSRWNELTPKEKAEFVRKTGVWKLYIPSVSMGAATIACIIGAKHVSAKRAAGLAAGYSIVEKSFDEYQKKVIEKIGERKNEQIHDEIAQDRIHQSWSEGVDIYGPEIGELFFDKFSALYFRSTVETVRSALNDFNQGMLHDGYMSLAEFYRILDIPAPVYAEHIGWNTDDKLVEIRFSAHLTPANKPCHAIEFKKEPTPDYGRFR